VSDLTAGKLTPKLSDRIADVRGRQLPTLSCPSSFPEAAGQPSLVGSRFGSRKLTLVASRSRPEAVTGERRLQGELKIIATVLARPVIKKILNHRGLELPPKAPGRGVTRISLQMDAIGRQGWLGTNSRATALA